MNIVVHPGSVGRGIGARLMADLLAWARDNKRLQKIELLVRASNARAIRLYERLGFVEEGRLRARVRLPDGRMVDDIAMAWFPRRG